MRQYFPVVRRICGRVLRPILFRPPRVRYSCQTIYKSLQGCIRLYQAGLGEQWLMNAAALAKILKRIQRHDGGFDVGYDYSFGLMHKAGESLSCESTAVLVLCEYYEIAGDSSVEEAIRRGLGFIVHNVSDVNGSEAAIPYAPYTTSEIAIINATSFAASALCVANATLDCDPALDELFTRMIRWLDSRMERKMDRPGRAWPYFDPDWAVPDRAEHGKVDYYHQAQQIEVHAMAEERTPCSGQRQILRDAADHLVAAHEAWGVLPYCNDPVFFGGAIHTWGLASLVPAMLAAGRLLPDRAAIYRRVATETMAWLIRHAWNGSFFHDILTPDGRPENTDYMVRSDAWVFQALADYTVHCGRGEWSVIAECAYSRMERYSFSGPEKHGKRRIQQFLELFQRH